MQPSCQVHWDFFGIQWSGGYKRNLGVGSLQNDSRNQGLIFIPELKGWAVTKSCWTKLIIRFSCFGEAAAQNILKSQIPKFRTEIARWEKTNIKQKKPVRIIKNGNFSSESLKRCFRSWWQRYWTSDNWKSFSPSIVCYWMYLLIISSFSASHSNIVE